MTAATRILVIDDDPAILRTLSTNLRARGYDVSAVATGEEGVHRFEEGSCDLVILDLMLPGLSGLDVCRAIRAESFVPILVLSARGEERTKVHALDLGADDYLTKPFGMDELLARIRAVLRRPADTIKTSGPIRVGPLVLDIDARQAWKDGVDLDLTPREFDVLSFMMQNAGKVVTHRLLLGQIWGPEYRDETQYLRVFINRLRHKVEDDRSHPRFLVTEPGVGYRMVPPPAVEDSPVAAP
jgi:two-component system, OmpR family, KDP operon response regulator KdpE